MEIIDQGFEVRYRRKEPAVLAHLEEAARACWGSEHQITPDSARRFVCARMCAGERPVLYHEFASVRITCSIAIARELRVYKHAAALQRSTRYVDYAGGVRFVRPQAWYGWDEAQRATWARACEACESAYYAIRAFAPPGVARGCLNLDSETVVYMTADIAEWRHIFAERVHAKAHADMQALMKAVAADFAAWSPTLFGEWGAT